MIKLLDDLRALPGLAARLIDAVDSIADSIDEELHERAMLEALNESKARTLETTRAVCPICAREWRAVSPVRVALLEWTEGNRHDFVIAVTHGNAQHIVHDSKTCELAR